MSGWKHSVEDTSEGIVSCAECWVIEYEVCKDATPDLTRPCTYDVLGNYGGESSSCGDAADQHPGRWKHPYQPSRCTCGHSIEAAAMSETPTTVPVEALLDAWEAQDPPSIDAAIQTALMEVSK